MKTMKIGMTMITKIRDTKMTTIMMMNMTKKTTKRKTIVAEDVEAAIAEAEVLQVAEAILQDADLPAWIPNSNGE